MGGFLKGNYKARKGKVETRAKKGKNPTAIFEEKALEKLGGSIAFVMKSNKLLWEADETSK